MHLRALFVRLRQSLHLCPGNINRRLKILLPPPTFFFGYLRKIHFHAYETVVSLSIHILIETAFFSVSTIRNHIDSYSVSSSLPVTSLPNRELSTSSKYIGSLNSSY